MAEVAARFPPYLRSGHDFRSRAITAITCDGGDLPLPHHLFQQSNLSRVVEAVLHHTVKQKIKIVAPARHLLLQSRITKGFQRIPEVLCSPEHLLDSAAPRRP